MSPRTISGQTPVSETVKTALTDACIACTLTRGFCHVKPGPAAAWTDLHGCAAHLD